MFHFNGKLFSTRYLMAAIVAQIQPLSSAAPLPMALASSSTVFMTKLNGSVSHPDPGGTTS